ncbi:hypothetical protein J3R82DRAFT_9450 [Butyriboletus roseoflavus]|nr:hypothetical protein J3R82DRAFT_9450 [Butyriboletus roseoflavus]
MDTIRRRMMMTSGEKASIVFVTGLGNISHHSCQVHYKSFIDATRQIVVKEGSKALFSMNQSFFDSVLNLIVRKRWCCSNLSFKGSKRLLGAVSTKQVLAKPLRSLGTNPFEFLDRQAFITCFSRSQ